MLMHQQLNNESLDEDYKQQERVIRMIKRNELIEQNKDLNPDLTSRENSVFNLSLLNLVREVEGNLEEDEEGLRRVSGFGKVAFYYDRLCQTILSLKLNDKSNKDRMKIYQILDDTLLPKLDELEYKATQLGVADAYIVPYMIDNIKSRKFNQITTNKDLSKKYVETIRRNTDRQLRQIERNIYNDIPGLEEVDTDDEDDTEDDTEDENDDDAEDENYDDALNDYAGFNQYAYNFP